jgi:site-specific DNA-methyltransferase (adenine-specific)
VGTHDSLLMVVMGDNYGKNVYNRNRSVHQERPPIGSRKQCLGTPFRLAFVMANTGWLWRMTIIWDKDGRGHPESVTDRPTTNHEYILVFAQQRRHYWDADAVRVKRKTKEHLQSRGLKDGVIRADGDHKHQILGQPLLKNVRSVWRIPPVPYPGEHPATLPLKLVEQMLLAGCPPGGTVCDPFGGPATVALGALRLGMKAISIDINRKWTDEGFARLKAARTSDDDDEMLGTQEHHERLKNATAPATQWQDRYYELCRKVGEKPQERMIPAFKIAAIDATVKLPFGDLYHGDCLSVVSSLPDQTIDLAVWDLPFGVAPARSDNQVDLIQLWSHTLRLLKPHGVVIAFGVQPFTSQLVMSQPELYRHQWQRPTPNSNNFARTDINSLRGIEDVLIFSGSGEFVFTPPGRKLDTPDRAQVRPHRSKITATMHSAFADTATPISLLDLQFSPGEQQIATQKPIAVMDFLIKTYTAKGATVLDPTAGSFLTGVACRASGRRFIGIEKLAKHFQFGVRRLSETSPADVEPDRAAAD